jgi:PAS domain S-box-containing protein
VPSDFKPVPDSLRLAAIVEGSDDAIIGKDVSGTITSWNAAAERMFGYRADEVIGRSIRLVVPPHRQSDEDEVLSRIGRGERVQSFQTERCRRSGEIFDVSLTVSPIRAPGGAIIGASTIARDITERTRTEKALAAALVEQAELRRRLSTIIAASGSLLLSPRIDDVLTAIVNVARDVLPADAYALWRIDGDVWRVAASSGLSPYFVAITYPAGTPIDLVPNQLRIVTDGDAEWLSERQAAYGVEGIRSLMAVPLQVGSEIAASIVFYFRRLHAFTEVEQESAEGFGILASAVINTAQMYESQRRSRYEADFIAEATSLLASSLDFREALGRLAHRIVPQIADWCGFYLATDDEAELETVCVVADSGLEASHVEAFDREDPGEPQAPFSVQQVIRSGAAVLIGDWTRDTSQETVGIGRRNVAGLIGVSSVIAVPLVAHARTLGAFTLGTAMSGRAFGSDDLRFAQDLAYRVALSIDNSLSYEDARAANRLKDEFLANLSHELRTPLNAIVGYARMLRTGALPEERRSRAYEVLDNNAAALTQIVEDVLDISRIVTGKIRLHVEPVAVAPIVATSVETVRPGADAKGIRIDLPADGKAVVAGDRDRLLQVFWNLLSNAVKFTPNRGSITIGVRTGSGMCEVSVADSGIGIERHVLPHVFERFRQGDSRFSREHGGLGLGLAIARQIVELHGGTISAESEGPGKGALFRVCLPLVERDGHTDGAG